MSQAARRHVLRAAIASRSRARHTGHGRGVATGLASQSLSRLQRGVQPVSPLSPGRRPEVRRLESVRENGSGLYAPVPRDHEPGGLVRSGHQPVDGFPRSGIAESESESGNQESGSSKFALARTIAAILGTLVLDQGDAAGVLAIGDRTHFVPPRSGHHHLRVLLAELWKLAPAGTSAIDGRCGRPPR